MAQYLGTLGAFVQWFALSLALTALFCVIYSRLTPVDEFKLIEQGNVSAAIIFGGAMLGYVLPLASVMVHGANLVDFAIWGGIAMVVQLLVALVMHRLYPNLPDHINADRVSVAATVAAVSLAVGILNAAAQTS